MALRYNTQATSGNLSTLVAGSTVGGAAVNLGDNTRTKVKDLSALVSVTAATATLTVSVKWQVSNDATVWVDLANGTNNAASVVFTTGTSSIVTKAIPAPSAVFGWRFARIALVTGVVTGAVGDLYALGYCDRSTRSLDG